MPLYLLDTELDENDPVDRWITARLYEGNPLTRLGQYGLLGIGTVRALRRARDRARRAALQRGSSRARGARARRRRRRVRNAGSTRRSPRRASGACSRPTRRCPLGTRATSRPRSCDAFADLPQRLGITGERFLDLCRTHAGTDEWPGMTPLALRLTRRANAVSLRHGEVAREMWRPLFARRAGRRRPDHARHERRPPADVPLRADARAARPPPRRGLARPRRRPGDLGAGRRHPRRGALGGAQRGTTAPRRVREGEVGPGPAAPRRGSGERQGGRRDVLRGHADARLRPPDRDVQAPVPADVRPRARAPDLRRRAAAPDGRGRQGAPARRQREADARRRVRAVERGRDHVTRRVPRELRPVGRRRRSSAAATSGSTSRARRSRRAAPAG